MVRLVDGHIVPDDDGSDSTCGRVGAARINLFGFQLPLYWAGIIAAFALMRFGTPGLIFVALAAGLSHVASGIGGSDGGGGVRRRREERMGTNIKGMDDLPKPPPSS